MIYLTSSDRVPPSRPQDAIQVIGSWASPQQRRSHRLLSFKVSAVCFFSCLQNWVSGLWTPLLHWLTFCYYNNAWDKWTYKEGRILCLLVWWLSIHSQLSLPLGLWWHTERGRCVWWNKTVYKSRKTRRGREEGHTGPLMEHPHWSKTTPAFCP